MIKYTLLKIKIFFIVLRKLGIITAGVKTLILPLKILDHELPHDGKILDIGCGEGLYGLAARLLRRNIDLTILDNDQVKIEKAERICKPNKIINTKFEHYENDSSYDFIIVNDFMHHIDYESHHVFIAKIKSLLVKNGKFFFKDVDQSDGFDNKITKFFDLKIEPNLKICFREKNEWVKLIERNGLSYSNAYKYFNVWVASRTIIIFLNSQSKVNQIKLDQIDYKKNIILLTGASGFIGSHLVKFLLSSKINNCENHLILMVRNYIPQYDNIENCSFLISDFDELNNFKYSIQRIDFVFHFASEVKFNKPIDPFRHNCESTTKLVKFLDNYKIKKFILGSTLGVLERGPFDDCSKLLDENSSAFPKSIYGKSKLKSEEVIINSSIPYNIVRIPWAYGLDMTLDTHLRFFLNKVINKSLLTKFNFIGKVSIIEIDDLCRSLKIIVERLENNKIIHVSDGVPISLGNIFSTMQFYSKKNVIIFKIPKLFNFLIIKFRRFLPTTIQSLSNDVLATSNKELVQLGFKPLMTPRMGIAKFCQSIIKPNEKDKLLPITLITGTSSGLGKDIFQKMIQDGHRVVSIDSSEDGNLNFDYFIKYDLSNLDELDCKIKEFLNQNNFYIENLINNAGVLINSDLSLTKNSEIKKIININSTALTILSSIFLNQNINSKISLINISSSSSFSPIPNMALYTATKSFVNQLTLTLIAENKSENIKIKLVIPAGMKTGFQKKYSLKERKGLLKVGKVSQKIILNLNNSKNIIFIGSSTYVLYFLQKLLGLNLNLKIIKYLSKRFL